MENSGIEIKIAVARVLIEKAREDFEGEILQNALINICDKVIGSDDWSEYLFYRYYRDKLEELQP